MAKGEGRAASTAKLQYMLQAGTGGKKLGASPDRRCRPTVAAAVPSPVFRFNAEAHEYFLNGSRIKSVTQLLSEAGLISDAWYDDKSAERGHQVHELCTARDLGAIEDLRRCDSPVKGWLLAYEAFLATVRPEWTAIEEAAVSLVYRVGGRPDRVGKLWGVEAIVDIKSGACEPWHAYQGALYDIVLGDLPVGVRRRYGLYLARTGKFRLIEFKDRSDYDRAFEVIHRCR